MLLMEVGAVPHGVGWILRGASVDVHLIVRGEKVAADEAKDGGLKHAP